LFGFGTLDPKRFAAELNYTEGYLRKKHPNPAQLQKLTEEEITSLYEQEAKKPALKVFDSYLENALYILHTTTLRFSRAAKEVLFEKGTTKYTNISESYVLLPKLITTTLKGKGSPKILFNYDINENFITNLSLYFLKFNKESLITLRRAGLDDLYLYLKNFKETLQERGKTSAAIDRTLNFNHLCTIARIPFLKKDGTEFKNPRDIKKKLIEAFNTINRQTDLKFEVKWGKSVPTSRWKYLPSFYFSEENISTPIYSKILRNTERLIIFGENLRYELLHCFKKHNELAVKDIELAMLQWLKSDKDIAEKELAFRSAQYKTFGMVHRNIDRLVAVWIAALRRITSLNEMIHNEELRKSF
jgi:hypothetical protein